jgi:hypothetical protein
MKTRSNTLRQRWERVKFWFSHKRVCNWCQPPHFLGGNPFARKITHGMCPKAVAEFTEAHP